MPPILLLDGYSLFFRAFHGLPPDLATTSGEPTSGIYGFAMLVLKLLREERPAGAAIAIDAPRATFRHVAWKGYKATRTRAPTPLTRQLGRFGDLLAAFGFPIHVAPEYEADDVLATLARELRVAGEEPLVVTGDLDLLQCAVGRGRVHAVARGTGKGRTYDEAAVWARYGVSPAELPDWKALAGDPTDNLPGVPGIGGKTAAALIRRFGGVPGILANLGAVEPPRVRDALLEARDDLPLWRDLATLRDEVPLGDGPRWLPFGPAQRVRVRELFEELEFRSLLARLDALDVTGAAPHEGS